ncbi:hypothetical protein [Sphingomonas sp.]|uniref:hypothetical protein n=1 Tax=Sphingomonas sp. TaxID=28214 RepID=UPI0031DBD800
MALTIAGCGQGVGRGADDRLADADRQERVRQEQSAKEMVAQTEDQVRVKMLEQRIAALEAQVAAMQGDRKLLDAQLVEQRLNQIEAQNLAVAGASPAGGSPAPSPLPASSHNGGKSIPAPKPAATATPPARKPLVLDLR